MVLNPNAEPFDPESPCSSTLEFDPNLVRNDISFEFFENKIGSYESPINEDDSEAFIEDQMYSFDVPLRLKVHSNLILTGLQVMFPLGFSEMKLEVMKAQ